MTRAPGSYAGLTIMQADLLSFLRARELDGGHCPSYVEMAELLGLASKSGIHRLIMSLEERGYITRLHHKSRSIQCVDRAITDREAKKPATVRTLLQQFSIGELLSEIEARGLKVMAE